MNNEIIIQKESANIGIAGVMAIVAYWYDEVLAMISGYYSRTLEEEVSVSATKALINAQCAFFALIMPMDLGYVYRIVALLWFVLAVRQCRERL